MAAASPVAFSIVPVVVTIPMVIMFDAASISDPIAREELPVFISGSKPPSANIWSTSPIPCVPFPVVSNGVPITVDPQKFRRRLRRYNVNDAWRRRRSNSNTYGYLTRERRVDSQNRRCEQRHHD
jgi:hypothetical protein